MHPSTQAINDWYMHGCLGPVGLQYALHLTLSDYQLFNLLPFKIGLQIGEYAIRNWLISHGWRYRVSSGYMGISIVSDSSDRISRSFEQYIYTDTETFHAH